MAEASKQDQKAEIIARNVFEVVGEHWVLEVEFNGETLYFEMKDKDRPNDQQMGGWIGKVDPTEFIATLRQITGLEE